MCRRCRPPSCFVSRQESTMCDIRPVWMSPKSHISFSPQTPFLWHVPQWPRLVRIAPHIRSHRTTVSLSKRDRKISVGVCVCMCVHVHKTEWQNFFRSNSTSCRGLGFCRRNTRRCRRTAWRAKGDGRRTKRISSNRQTALWETGERGFEFSCCFLSQKHSQHLLYRPNCSGFQPGVLQNLRGFRRWPAKRKK